MSSAKQNNRDLSGSDVMEKIIRIYSDVFISLSLSLSLNIYNGDAEKQIVIERICLTANDKH